MELPNQSLTQAPAAPPPPVVEVIMPRRNLREAVEDVFYDLGGSEGMISWVKESTANRRIFYKDILPKLIPKQLTGEFSGPQGGPMRMVVEWAEGSGEVNIANPAGMVMTAIVQAIADDES